MRGLAQARLETSFAASCARMRCKFDVKKKRTVDPFDAAKAAGLRLPHVEASVRYDGSPVLKMRGCFMAALATHPSAEPDTLVIRMSPEERQYLLDDAPDTYYVTAYYQKHPVVLVRLSRVDRAALEDLMSVSWRLTAAKTRRV